jgi:hypothetical protein
MPSGEWHPSNYAAEIVQELIDTQVWTLSFRPIAAMFCCPAASINKPALLTLGEVALCALVFEIDRHGHSEDCQCHKAVCSYPQFQKYLDDVEKAARDCARAVRRLVEKGPPIWLSDQNALPIPEGDTHIEQVRCSCLFFLGGPVFFLTVHYFFRFRMRSLFVPSVDGKDAAIEEKKFKRKPQQRRCVLALTGLVCCGE